MENLISVILSLIIGLTSGFAISIGLKPRFEQPKNIKIQILISILALIFAFILYVYLGMIKF